MKSPLIQIILLIGLSFMLGIIRFFMLSDAEFTFIKVERELQKGSIEEDSNFEIPDMLTEPMMINSQIAFNLFTTNRATFIDARDVEEFEAEHIQNAVNIPYDYYENYLHVIEEFDTDFGYIVYCSGGECSLSLDLADYLFEVGLFNMFVYEGGLPEWIENGYPIE